MTCKVVCVYRDIDGKQCGVDFEVNGKSGSMPIKKFIDKCKDTNLIKENFRIIPEGIAGKGCNLEFKQFTLWSDLKKNYPDKWVVLDKVMYDDKCTDGIYCGIVINILDDDEINEYMKSLYSKNIYYDRFRTTYLEDFVGGALYL